MEEQDQREKRMTELWLEMEGSDGVFAIFQEDEGSGYFFVYKPDQNEVLEQIRIYERGHTLSVTQEDIQLMWSADHKKCGVIVWGQMRGIIDLANKQEKCAPLENRHSPGIIDPEWLKGFKNYMEQNQFIRARQRYWKEMVKRHENIQPRPEQETPIETNFICYEKSPQVSLFAVFEDDVATGYLYIYDPEQGIVTRHLHLYDRSEKLPVAPEDVQVMWSEGSNKCGVAIWEKMRGVIDLERGQEGRVWLQSRETPGIDDAEWLNGFQ